MDPLEIAKQVHKQGQAGQKQTPTPVVTKKEDLPKEEITPPVVKKETPAPPVYTPAPPIYVSGELSDKAKQMARADIDPALYSQEPIQVHMKIFNKEIRDFIQDFKKNNQHVGGKPFNQTIATEIMLEVLYYDIGIRPYNENTGRGFQSPEEFRAYLQEKLKKQQ
jgi:hypothetical protein